jgi:hypothetical protein
MAKSIMRIANRNRVYEALVQHAQYDVHDEHCSDEQQQLVGQVASERERRALECRMDVAGNAGFLLGVFNRIYGCAQRDALREIERNGHSGELREVVDQQWPCLPGDLGNCRQGHLSAPC